MTDIEKDLRCCELAGGGMKMRKDGARTVRVVRKGDGSGSGERCVKTPRRVEHSTNCNRVSRESVYWEPLVEPCA